VGETRRRLTQTTQGRTLPLPLSLSLATLVTPTTSSLVQDNISLIPPCVSSCINPSGQGHATINSLVDSIEGPRGSETPTVGAPGRGLLRVNKHFPIEFQMGSLQQPLQPGTVLRFGILEFMSRDGSYDMVLLPLQHDNNDGRRLARRRRTRRRLPPVAEEEHPGLPRHPPRRRRRRRGNRDQAGGGTSPDIGPERVDDAGTPAGDMSGVVLAPETTTSVASPQRANPKRTDDASTLAKDLLGVSLVPEITVHSVPDATSPPSIDQEVPSVFHPVPFRFSFDPPSDPASVSAFARAYPDLPGYHMWSTWDRLTTISTYGPAGSEEEDDPDFGWDFFGLSDPSAMRDFMFACDYCLSGCSDDGHNLDDEGCGPSRECFHVDQGDHDEGNHLGMLEDDDPPRPVSRMEIPRELASSSLLCSILHQSIWAGTRNIKFTGRIEGPRGSETPTVGAPGRGSLRVDKYFLVEFQMGSLQQPLQPRTVLRFGSLEFMSRDGSYDMVLFLTQHDNNDGRWPGRRR
jgi:hypothetical protein